MSRRIFHAFTLVELMVVMAIIALLVAVLLPALQRARKAANTIYCLSNVRQIAFASMQYVIDNRGVLLDRTQGANDGSMWVAGFPNSTPGNGYPDMAWMDEIYYRLNQSIGVLECPEQQYPRRPDNFYQLLKSWGGSLAPRRPYWPGYFQTVNTHRMIFAFPGITPALKYKQFRNPSEKIWYGDSGRVIDNSITHLPVEVFRPKSWYGNSGTQITSSTGASLSYRHGTEGSPKCNVVFFDGHGETIDPRGYEIWGDMRISAVPSATTAERQIWGKYWDPDGDGSVYTP